MFYSHLIKDKIQYFKGDTVKGRFSQGAFWSLVNILLGQGLNFLASIFIARELGQKGFGQYGLILNTFLMFSAFTTLGLGITLIKFLAQLRTDNPNKAGRIIGTSLFLVLISSTVAGLGILIYSKSIATSLLHNEDLANNLTLACALIVFTSLTSVYTGALSGLEAFKEITKANALKGFVSFVIVSFLIISFSIEGALMIAVVMSGLMCFLFHFFLITNCRKRNIKITYKLSSEDLPILVKFSFPTLLLTVAATPSIWLAQTLLTRYPQGYNELGIIHVANQWQQIIMLIPTTLANVTLPLLSSELQEGKDQINFDKIMEINQALSIIVLIPISTCVFFLSDSIMQIYGKDFNTGVPIFMCVVAGISISGIGYPAGTALQAKGKMWLSLIMNLSWAFLLITITYFFSSEFGGLSYASGFAIAHLALLVWGYMYISPDLPKGMLKRTFCAVAVVLLNAWVAMVIPVDLRQWIMIPALVISTAITFYLIAVSPVFKHLKSIVK